MRRDPRWLFAALTTGLGFLGPDHEIEIELESDLEANAAALAVLDTSADPEALAEALGATLSQADEILDALIAAGALLPEDVEPRVAPGLVPLAEVVREPALGAADPRGAASGTTIATAEELLFLPAGLETSLTTRAVRAFVAGLEPELRLRAYCEIATTGVPAVLGDLPEPGVTERALETARRDGDPRDVLTVHLESGLVARAEPERLGRIGCDSAHRLGPVLSLDEGTGGLSDPELHVCAAQFALPNLRFPGLGKRLAGGRSPDRELSALIARAEAAERYAGGDPAPHDFFRALEAELHAAPLHPDQVARANARQRASRSDIVPYDPAVPHTWIEGVERDGTRRSVPAGIVFYPFVDPVRHEAICRATSSGTAAHTDLAEARTRALSELMERDAFMWTWVQRVSREHVHPASLGPDLGRRVAAVEATGLSVALVNLTLDTLPVILCVLHTEDKLGLGMASARDPEIAAGRAFDEAVSFLPLCVPRAEGRLAASEVSSPEEHAQWHQYRDQVERDTFLFSSPDRVELADIRAPDVPEAELAAAIGEPVTVDLTSPATHPFRVVRVLVPEMIPISFGYDREPLGMDRLGMPKATHDGRTIGRSIDLERAGPIDPHPFA